jgi:hypothetical protein
MRSGNVFFLSPYSGKRNPFCDLADARPARNQNVLWQLHFKVLQEWGLGPETPKDTWNEGLAGGRYPSSSTNHSDTILTNRTSGHLEEN